MFLAYFTLYNGLLTPDLAHEGLHWSMVNEN